MELKNTLALLAALILITRDVSAQALKLERVHSLRPEEGVFAYARISPDGRYLVYASQARDPTAVRDVPQMVTLIDLRSDRILFTERGVDAYWSPDGERMIYSSAGAAGDGVSIRHLGGRVTRNVVPNNLGDYYSWGMRDGRNLILTINNNYYYLDGDMAVLPSARVQACPGIGTGERPLLSKDGTLISTFVRGTVVVRNLMDCNDTFDTGLRAAKADFSWDGRYIAMHLPKPVPPGYDIDIVDLKERTVRTLALAGSSIFPSWTRDGRLCFRYDGKDYRGFMMASNVLGLPAKKLTGAPGAIPAVRTWVDLFPETTAPRHRLNLVMVWATWSAHSPVALRDLQRAEQQWQAKGDDIGVMMATDPGSRQIEIDQMLRDNAITLTKIPLGAARLPLTEATNQVPVTIMFRDGVLVGRKLGAQTAAELRVWVSGAR